MKIKILSDGTARGTKVINQETGEEIDPRQLVSIEWYCNSTDKRLAEAKIEFRQVPVEIVAEV